MECRETICPEVTLERSTLKEVVCFIFGMGCVASFEKSFYNSIMVSLELLAGSFSALFCVYSCFSPRGAFICFKKQREKTRSSLKQ